MDGAPDGWFVGTDNGQITGVFDKPSEVNKPITMTLNAVDEGGQIASVENYTFTVVKPPEWPNPPVVLPPALPAASYLCSWIIADSRLLVIPGAQMSSMCPCVTKDRIGLY